jgi:glucokinase
MLTNTIKLIADIGGTNARFAIANQNQPGFSHERSMDGSQFAGIDQAIQRYLELESVGQPTSMCLAIAGPVIDQQAQLTNSPWVVSAQDLSRQLGGCPVKLINDFTAVALSLAALGPADLQPIGTDACAVQLPEENYTVGVLGPGTGLGIAGLLRREDALIPLPSEAGHMGFAPETRKQSELLQALHERWPRVSIERLVSGQGLENTYWALNHLERGDAPSLTAAEIFEKAINQQDQQCLTAVDLFFEMLGQVAGDVALAYGAEQGIYIAGGIVKRYPGMLHASTFRKAFENKGRHKVFLERIPTNLITHPQPGLLGAACCPVD